ncbi:hypothetical protein C900_01760 [Fulvivirga imtechensis AK7]|uniref:Putative cysteine ligase BshC n=1 Tax=Fulvivirga imtechensis AK7 TaxID=1237149 RepID=L8JTA2_9BACT|nr:bacillithiol biosynthesis cysteine-adding enzyme BshC [Fulvivirga imtechensis]ELR72206.1 hypothetical protein C900_01760 [Fulvivirga imtechensis AK7]
MDLTKVAYRDTHQFSPLFLDYINDKSQLREFYGERPEVNAFRALIHKRNFPPESRKILCQALNRQYRQLIPTDHVRKNLSLLESSDTFTITTGHQLNIFTGPLYFIYKIISVINSCKRLKETYPDKNFVPVYWMASEDHDFDEISYFRLNGRKHQWQTNQKGAVGNFNPKELKELVSQIPGIPDLFKEAYLKHDTLADAVRYYVNELFGAYGLVVVDADCVELKKLLIPVIKDDIFDHTPNDLVEKQSMKLDQMGYKAQIFPRKINFFYMADNLRSRIVEEDGRYSILDSELSFTEDEIKADIEAHPEHYSPNVVLRPVYQEMVLPNLAYVGGPAEVAYWLQLKPVFDHFGISFPALIPRNFAMILPKHIHEKWAKTGLTLTDLFLDKDDLFKKAVKAEAAHDIHLNGEMQNVMSLFEKIKAQAAKIDPTLAPHVEAQQAKTKSRLEIIEKKFIRAEKRHQSDKLRQIENVLGELFPNGTPQERIDNFLNFYLGNSQLIDQLAGSFDPFDYRYVVLKQ